MSEIDKDGSVLIMTDSQLPLTTSTKTRSLLIFPIGTNNDDETGAEDGRIDDRLDVLVLHEKGT